MDEAAAMARIRSIVEEQNDILVTAETDDLVIDSLTILLIITFARETLEISLDTDKLDFDNFTSLAAIRETVFSGRYLREAPE